MRRVIILSVVVMCLALFLPFRAQEGGAAEWVLAGSGTNTLLTEVLVKAFMEKNPGVRIKVIPSIGSTGGIKAVHVNKIAVGLASRPFRGLERTWGLKALPYARTVIAFGVNPSVLDDNLSKKDVLDIYSGKRKKWSDGGRIFVLAREEGDSSVEVLSNNISGFKAVIESAWRSGTWRVEYRDSDNNATIERIKDSVGWTDLGSIRIENRKIKPLKYNGVLPTEENQVSGKYPLYKDLFLVYREELPEPLREFVNFVKSGKGAELIRKNGYIPLQ